MPQANPDVTVCIVTHNRREELTVALESTLAQQKVAFDIRVYDNASQDGTTNVLRERFPEVHVHAFKTNAGACHARNQALVESSAPYIFFMDDDAYFTDPTTLAAALDYMRSHPGTAAAGLPFVEPASRRMSVWTPPVEYHLKGACAVRSVVTCACIAQRKPLLDLGGFRESFLQWGEERDLCIRLLARAYAIEFIRAPQLVHSGSRARDSEAMQYLGIRNTLLFDMLNVPWPWVVVQMFGDAARLTVHRFFKRGGARRLVWVCRALCEALRNRREREPVSRAVYAQYRRLPGHGPIAAVSPLPLPATRKT